MSIAGAWYVATRTDKYAISLLLLLLYSSYCDMVALRKLTLALQNLVGNHPFLFCFLTLNRQIIVLHKRGSTVWASRK